MIFFKNLNFKNMRTKKIFFVQLIIFCIMLFSSKVFSQLDNMQFPDLVCGMSSQNNQYVMPYFPMDNDILHALVVFCNFPSPSGDFDLTNTCLLQYWPGTGGQGQIMPSWADDIICPNTNNIWNPTITGYFKTSSMGRFQVTGDVYPNLYVFQNQVSYYAASDKKMGYAIKELLESIEDNIDWSEYDNFDPEDIDNDNNRREPDGIVDFIFIVFRFTNAHTIDPDAYGRGYSGIACLGGRDYCFGPGVTEITTHDNYRILAKFPGSGCIGMMTNPWELGVLTHEFGEHYSYDAGHSERMGTYNINGGGIASAYDREHNGWNTTSAITPLTNTMGIELRDYVTTNDYIKIQRQNEVLYLENRRRFSYYSKVDDIIWKWNCSDPVRPIQSDSMLLIYRNTGYRLFDVQSAFGKFNWQLCPGNRYKSLYFTQRNNFFFTESPNRSGLSTFDLCEKQISDLNCNNISDNASYWGGGGDFNTCFDVGYNDVISPWSNPPLQVVNQYDSLTIEISGRNASGNLLVNVYFTNITDARPSKPQGLQIGWSECINGIKYPQLTWEHNLEPDMLTINVPPFDCKKYKIFRAYALIGGGEEPINYTEIAEQNFSNNSNPVFIDYDASMECDLPVEPEVAYDVLYRVQAIDVTNLASSLSDSVSTQTLKVRDPGLDNLIVNSNIPKSFILSQNYPNPFNPITNIKYEIPKDLFVTLKVYDLLGREIKTLVNEYKEAGNYIVSFNGSELSSGIYFYRIQAGNFIQVKRMVLIK